MSNVKKGAFFNLNLKVLKHLKVLASEMKMSQGEVIEYFIEQNIKGRSEEHKLIKDTISALLDEKLLSVTDDLKEANDVLVNIQKEIELFKEDFGEPRKNNGVCIPL